MYQKTIKTRWMLYNPSPQEESGWSKIADLNNEAHNLYSLQWLDDEWRRWKSEKQSDSRVLLQFHSAGMPAHHLRKYSMVPAITV